MPANGRGGGRGGLHLLATSMVPLREAGRAAVQEGEDVLYVRVLPGGRIEAFAASPQALDAVVEALFHWRAKPIGLDGGPLPKGTAILCPRCGKQAERDGMRPAQSFAPASPGKAWWYTGFACGNPDCEFAGVPLMQMLAVGGGRPDATRGGTNA